MTEKDEQSDESETEEDPVEEVVIPVKKLNGNGKKIAEKSKIPVEEEKVEDGTALLGKKAERKSFQWIDDTMKENLPEELKNNSYDVIFALK